MQTVKFNSYHLSQLEKTLSVKQGINDASIAVEILTIFDGANNDGVATIAHVDYSECTKLIEFIGNYCTVNNIQHDILCENDYFNLYLY